MEKLSKLRIGIGHDTHRLRAGGPLRLGGVTIPHDHELIGHSDADVLLHAVTDALLGAAGMGDIGELFPDYEASNKDRDSVEMLTVACVKLAEDGYSIINVDCTVFAQAPKLTPHKKAIRERIAETLGIEPDCVGVKAKTGEGVGAVGAGQSMEAQCVALLVKP